MFSLMFRTNSKSPAATFVAYRSLRCLSSLFAFSLALAITPLASASDESPRLLQQRAEYQELQKLLKKDYVTVYRRRMRALKDYPLYPYLEFGSLKWSLQNAGSKAAGPVTSATLASFKKRYPDLPLHRELKQSWLWSLAKQKNKSALIKHYEDVNDANLFCAWVTARYGRGQRKAVAADIKRYWNKNGVPAKGCNEEVAALIKSDLLPNAWLVDKLLHAMRNGRVSEVKYLQKRLPKGSSGRASIWLATHKDPRDRSEERFKAIKTGKKLNDDSLYSRLTIAHGIRRAARSDADKAKLYWNALRPRYRFSAAEVGKTDAVIALHGAAQQHQLAEKWIDAVPTAYMTDKLRSWRLRLGLVRRDWAGLQKAIERMDSKRKAEPQWRYWQARALQEQGKTTAANELFAKVVAEEGYYGFMAADQIKAPYSIRYQGTPVDRALQGKLLAREDLQRARELYRLGEMGQARREWGRMQKRIDKNYRRQSAILAHDWGWWRQSIGAFGNIAEPYDLVRRFPTPWQSTVNVHSKNNEIEPSWAYSIMRAESLFQPDAKSRVGARGLMQLMPATAKSTARKIKLPYKRSSELYRPETNIPLGTKYLGIMMDRFDGHIALSTAAYNAGPGRVDRWRPQTATVPADIWIDTIPFTETRRYVRKVLKYTVYFDWRKTGKPSRLSDRVPAIKPPGKL